MPSDCQCSYHIEKPSNYKKLEERLQKLEKRISKLCTENRKLKKRLEKAERPTKFIVNDLINYLNKYID